MKPIPTARRRRHGFLLYLVLGVLAVVGILLFSLDMVSRQRNRLAHRMEWGRVAGQLADGGVSYVQYLCRSRMVDPAGLVGDLDLPLTSGGLFGFLLQPCEDLEEAVEDASAGELMEQWFGPDWRIPISDMEADVSGSSVELRLVAEATPLHPEESPYRDAIEKEVTWGLEVSASYRGVTRTARRTYQVRVVHPFPPVTSKFSLFVKRVPDPANEFNVFENDEAGEPTGTPAQRPFVVRSTPLGAVDDRTLITRNRPHVLAGDPWAEQAELRDHLHERGYIYLGSGPGNPSPVQLNLTAGPELREVGTGLPVPGENGEFFHFVDPVHRHSNPSYYRLLPGGAPDPFQGPLTESDGSQKQAFIHFLFWGFHTVGSYDLEDAGLGGSLGSKRSSALHLFGDDDDPSRAIVHGNVDQRFIRIAYLAVDRLPDEDDDEAIQEAALAAAGLADRFNIYPRDTIEPVLAHVGSDRAWEEELRREASGEPLVDLYPIPTESSGLPAPRNRNFARDRDGDGFMDVVLDPGHPTVPLDGSVFRYAHLFPHGYSSGDKRGYEDYMSRVLTIPYNQVIDYMVYPGWIPPEKMSDGFPGWTAGDLEALSAATDFALDAGDPIHQHYRVPELFRGDLSTFLDDGFEEVVRRRTFVHLPDQDTFLRRYQLAANPGSPDDPIPWLFFDDVAMVESGGLELPPFAYPFGGTVVVASGDVILNGVESRGHGLLTVIALSGDIVLQGSGPFQALLAAPRGELVNGAGSPLGLRGSLALGSLRSENLVRGGEIRWDGSGDPTRYHGGGQLSWADFYHLGLSDFPVQWRPSD